MTTGVKDTEGNALAEDYTWSFTTGGSYAPSKLYVSNQSGNSILVFNNAGKADGNLFPDRNISGGNTTLATPVGIWLDTD